MTTEEQKEIQYRVLSKIAFACTLGTLIGSILGRTPSAILDRNSRAWHKVRVG